MTQNILQKNDVINPEIVRNPGNGRVYQPATDIVEAADHWLLRADMPGVDEKALDVTVEREQLTIAGRVDSPAIEGYRLAYGEYGVGDYHRTFTLSDEVNRDGIEAVLKNGVLRLRIPKAPSARPHKVAVKVE